MSNTVLADKVVITEDHNVGDTKFTVTAFGPAENADLFVGIFKKLCDTYPHVGIKDPERIAEEAKKQLLSLHAVRLHISDINVTFEVMEPPDQANG